MLLSVSQQKHHQHAWSSSSRSSLAPFSPHPHGLFLHSPKTSPGWQLLLGGGAQIVKVATGTVEEPQTARHASLALPVGRATLRDDLGAEAWAWRWLSVLYRHILWCILYYTVALFVARLPGGDEGVEGIGAPLTIKDCNLNT